MGTVRRDEARSLENRFLSRFSRRLKEIRLIHNPLRNAATETLGGRQLEGSDEIEVKAAVRRHVPSESQAKAFEEMPRNATFVMTYARRRFFGGSKPEIAAAAAVFNPIEELARDGESSRPASAADLTAVIQKITSNPKVFYYIAVFSPTGWEEAAHEQLMGRNYIVSLADPYGGGIRTSMPTTGAYSRKVFDLMGYPEKFQMLQELLEDCSVELILGDFDENLVLDRLYFWRDVIEPLFEDAARNDPFLLLDNRRSPIRLVREIAHGKAPPVGDAKEQEELLARRDSMARDNARVQRTLKDLQALSKRENALLAKGAKAPDTERRLLAHQLRRIRNKHKELSARLEIFQKRYRVTSGYVQTLEQILAAKTESMPDPEKIETMMARAGVARDQIKELADLAEAGSKMEERETSDVDDIMSELQSEEGKTRERREEEKAETDAIMAELTESTEKEGEEPPPEKPEEPEQEEEEGMVLE
jgi:hypothetical protein